MRFLALALFVAAAASCCLAFDDVEELMKMAEEAGAPFTQTSLKRLQQKDQSGWEHRRANRTTDVIVINSSGKSFRLAKSDCALGAYSSGLLPENQLQQSTSFVYGIESSKYLQGVQCTTRYEGDDGSFITLMIDNPFFGDNVAYPTSSWNLRVVPILGHGENNQARFMVSEYSRAGRLGGQQRPKSKPKGNRNKMVMIAKQGSQVNQI